MQPKICLRMTNEPLESWTDLRCLQKAHIEVAAMCSTYIYSVIVRERSASLSLNSLSHYLR